MKIAVITDDGKTISQHFGRATQYVVVTAEGEKIVKREIRQKAGHKDFSAGEQHHGHECGCHAVHGHQQGDEEKHVAMASVIQDTSVLLAGGMGMGAYESLKSHYIDPVITDVTDIDQAIKLYLAGKLTNLMARLH
jgi:predicted Fe-Mo cluster-binding NifX family protein